MPTLLWAPLTNRFVVVAMLSILWMGCIGFLDDYLKIVQGKSRGLVAKWKLAGQVSFGLLLGLFLAFYPAGAARDASPPPPRRCRSSSTWWSTSRPGSTWSSSPWSSPGSSNAVNLTDGLDGLATGLAGISAAAFADVRLPVRPGGRRPRTSTSSTCPGAGELAVFCAALMGATIGFLWFNAHPAQVFMGDTGSLAIGGALGTVAILLKAEFLLLLIGGVFAAEAVSGAAPDRHLQVVQAHPGPGVRRRPPGLPHGAAAPPLREARLGRDHGGDPVLHPRAVLRAGGALAR